MDTPKLVHWADVTADRLIRKSNDRDHFVVASGITPSGIVHFGNFREVITVAFVAQALKERGKKVNFLFSWDDFDTFRKIPTNLPNQDQLKAYLFQPIIDTPDPFGVAPSYADHHKQAFEKQLKKVGITAQFISQSQKYKKGDYLEQIRITLQKREEIRAILNKHRNKPLPENWWPISFYCPEDNTDRVDVIDYDGKDILTYRHQEKPNIQGSIDLKKTDRVKLPWRIDWPMRWAYEKVDFEPGGKDHSSQGGSYTTAKEIVELFGGSPPLYLQYDFVSVKGQGGKMSSSSGNLVTLDDVLNVFEPEIVRWIFASYKPNVDFAISFDLDTLKLYEDFDRCERIAFDQETGNPKKVAIAKRAYQLAQTKELPSSIPFQPSFRHLCNVLQIHEKDLEKVKPYYKKEIKNERDERRLLERSRCALFWLEHYAPEDFCFELNQQPPSMEIKKEEKEFIQKFVKLLDEKKFSTDKELHNELYHLIHELDREPISTFTLLYQLLISKNKGPKLAGFIRTIGPQKVATILKTVS